jgi:hypothetical protein
MHPIALRLIGLHHRSPALGTRSWPWQLTHSRCSPASQVPCSALTLKVRTLTLAAHTLTVLATHVVLHGYGGSHNQGVRTPPALRSHAHGPGHGSSHNQGVRQPTRSRAVPSQSGWGHSHWPLTQSGCLQPTWSCIWLWRLTQSGCSHTSSSQVPRPRTVLAMAAHTIRVFASLPGPVQCPHNQGEDTCQPALCAGPVSRGARCATRTLRGVGVALLATRAVRLAGVALHSYLPALCAGLVLLVAPRAVLCAGTVSLWRGRPPWCHPWAGLALVPMVPPMEPLRRWPPALRPPWCHPWAGIALAPMVPPMEPLRR